MYQNPTERYTHPAMRFMPEGRVAMPNPRISVDRATSRIMPEGRVAKPMPRRPYDGEWSGNWRPHRVITTKTMGGLSDDIPTAPSLTPDPVNVTPFEQIQGSDSSSGGWLSNLVSGIGSIITPAAQALIGIKTAGVVQQAQQKTLAQTYNPQITAPAIQAQAWQNALQTGTGAMPSTALSLGALGLVAAGGLVLFLALRK